MMLEEILSLPNQPPAEVAQMLISYVNVELAAGGASSEVRFFNLFSLLCQRIFGQISTKDYTHQTGGWLALPRWERPPMAASSKSLGPSRNSSASIYSDPVVKLLGVVSSNDKGPLTLTLIGAFAKEAEHNPNVRYQFPFLGLPKHMQEDWLHMIQTARGGLATPTDNALKPSKNSIRLIGSLFRVKPVDQEQLIRYQNKKTQGIDHRRPLQLNPIFSPNQKSPVSAMMRSPARKETENVPPNISLSMLEYYLILFIRYPLAAPEIKYASSSARRIEPYGERVYYELFQEYTKHYIPDRFPQGAFHGFINLQRPTEIFVQVIIALWLERNRPLSTKESIQVLRDRRGLVSFDFGLNASFDLVFTKFDPLPNQINRCIRKLVEQVVSDGTLSDLVNDVQHGYKGSDRDMLCMTPIMEILQQPFYNLLRNTFRYASLHNKPHIFQSVFEDWLIWIEPWNTDYMYPNKRIITNMTRPNNGSKSRFVQITYPKAGHRSKYKPVWEAYIASNLHFYTVPLAIFLRRARELDFSSAHYGKSMNIVKRVMRVYTPEVVSLINRLLKERETGFASPTSPSSNKLLVGMVRSHESNLGIYAPPSTTLSLSSCQHDMKNLLEEISLQYHQKCDSLDFISRFFKMIFGSSAYQGEGTEFQALVHKAKIVVGFPKEYEVVPKSRKCGDYDSKEKSDQNFVSLLSENGRSQIIGGMVKCDREDIDFVGDKMYAKPQSHEIAFLVWQLVELSNMLNRKLGIQTTADDKDLRHSTHHFLPRRINLRFLADYRNMITVLFTIWFCHSFVC